MTGYTAEDRLGELRIDNGRAVVRYVRRLPQPPSTVWQAITEEQHLTAWFPTTIDGERAAGAALTFRFADVDVPPMTGTMLTFDPPSTMEFSWGDDGVRFEVAPGDDAGTVLTLVVTMAEIGKAARDAAGWHGCLDNLTLDVAGDRVESAGHPDRWRRLNDAYAERFGPEAATVGPPKEWVDKYGEA